jgi:oxygen-independent coproporphyrinogen III oxidase
MESRDNGIISNNTLYMSGIEAGNLVFECEELDENQKFNEFLLTALRTVWGVDLEQTELKFGNDRVSRLLVDADPLVTRGLMRVEKNKVVVPESAWLVSDNLISALFQV